MSAVLWLSISSSGFVVLAVMTHLHIFSGGPETVTLYVVLALLSLWGAMDSWRTQKRLP